MSKTAKLILGNETYEIPVVTGSENENGLDISKLRSSSKHITIDRGFKNTGACYSAITFLDGENGVLRYRGYPIEQLAEEATFLEVAYLLIYGDLPSSDELAKFENDITQHTLVHEEMKGFLQAYPVNAHPMGVLAAMVCSLSTFYPESQDPNRSQEAFDLTIIRLIAKMPTMAAWAFKHSQRHPLIYPQNKFNYCENFLNMMYSMPTDEYFPDPIVTKALNKLLILHADHEQNCSASTVRIVGSSQANLYASISAGVCALWGPLHGGANQAVIEMLEAIKNDGGDTDKWINKAKDKEDPFRLMGFGHRVYKNFDPRATIIKKSCDEVLEALGVDDPVLDIAKKLEKVALEDPYFVERGLYPNVDFYSGIIYRALGIPPEMFTVMFSLGRLPGWIAQWKEMLDNGDPIGRPRQIYTGAVKRDYVSLSKR
ncbi:MAG: citrate synthase [Crocinitomicaceae bacterium]|nr:citrate synthase [Crocinitomicaceae bacterium]MBT5401998.1 citrate synthase [Crocinitomicaceae bacterium]MBT6515293.1 citrate synthase [Crocinitomicaceae bacterium]